MSKTDLVPDEAYYWVWSHFPSTGYYDHPPMIAWWIWLSTQAFGNSQLGVRILPILSLGVSSIAVYGTVIDLYDDAALARRATLWFNAMLLMSIAMNFATPDAPSVMFWALDLWALARLRRTGNSILWIVIGVLAGAGCVSKYTNFFVGPGILLWLAVDPIAARWRLNGWPVAGGVVAFVVFLPVLLWNAGHEWISFTKQFGRIGDHHFGTFPLGELLIGQFGLMNPIIAIFATIAIWRFARINGRAADPFVLLAATTAPVVVYMFVHSLHDRVHPNWPAPAYPALAIAAAIAAGYRSNGPHLRRLALWATPVGIGLSSAVLLYFATPYGSAFPRTSPADLVIGWTKFAREVESARQKAGAAWIATTDYGITGELAFSSRDPANVQDIVGRRRYTFERPDQTLADKPALLVLPVAEGNVDRYLKCFASTGAIQPIARRAGARVIENYLLIVVSGAKADLLVSGCH